MSHTLRRSRSKYGRTRRQRRKQKHTRGGGIFDDFINKFKPSTPEEKCEKAKQTADEVCNSVSTLEPVEQQSGYDMSPPSELNSIVPEGQSQSPNSVAISDMSPPLEPLMSEDIAATPATPALNPEVMPPSSIEPTGIMPPRISEPGMEEKSLTQQPPPLPMQTVNFGGSRRKNKKNNKKQSRRKKMKSRKYKKKM